MINGQDVTVVIATIPGREDLLGRALRSVNAQQILAANVVVAHDDERAGAAATRNRAVAAVETDWVAFLDDDDELLPNHLRVMLRGANRSGADLIYTYAEFAGGRDPLAACDNQRRLVPEPINVAWGTQQQWWLRNAGNFIPVTNLVRTSAIRAVGGFPRPYGFQAKTSRDCEDYGLLLALLDGGYRFHHVCGVRTWRYHFHGANTGGRGADRMHELGGR